MSDRYNTIHTHQFLTRKAPLQLWYGEELRFKKKKKILGNMENILHVNFRKRSIFFFFFVLVLVHQSGPALS